MAVVFCLYIKNKYLIKALTREQLRLSIGLCAYLIAYMWVMKIGQFSRCFRFSWQVDSHFRRGQYR